MNLWTCVVSEALIPNELIHFTSEEECLTYVRTRWEDFPEGQFYFEFPIDGIPTEIRIIEGQVNGMVDAELI